MTYPQPSQYPGLQVIVKPGMSSTEHAIHLIAAFFTCGVWLIGYLLFALAAPPKKVEVIAPYGTPPEIVDAARRQALELTPAEAAIAKQRRTVMLWTILPILTLIVGFCAWTLVGSRIL